MLKTLSVSICSSLLLLVSLSVMADEKYEFSSEQQRLDFIQLSEELRCPKCQNQNIADSNALISTDMKRKVYELLQQGKSKEEVVHFMKARYGDFVHYKPPMTPLTFWLYFAPVLFIVAALSYFIYHSRYLSRVKQQTQSDTTSDKTSGDNAQASTTETVSEHNASKLAEAEKALRDLE